MPGVPKLSLCAYWSCGLLYFFHFGQFCRRRTTQLCDVYYIILILYYSILKSEKYNTAARVIRKKKIIINKLEILYSRMKRDNRLFWKTRVTEIFDLIMIRNPNYRKSNNIGARWSDGTGGWKITKKIIRIL